jgi:hypothetical protein
MKFLFFVFFPFLIQLMVGLIVMFSHKPGGEFVGLGAMLLSLVGIPVSTMINWQRIRAQPPKSIMQLFAGTFYTTLPFLMLCVGLYILAS